MKIQYKDDGTILGLGYADFKAEPGVNVAEVDFDIPTDAVNYYTFDGKTLVKKDQTQIDKIKVEANFNCDLAKFRLFQAFQANFELLLKYAGLVNPLIDYKNFKALKAVADSIEKADSQTFKQVFLDQGIDLEKY